MNNARGEVPAAAQRARVLVVSGDRAGRSHSFADSLSIGRTPASELQLDEPEVSRRHARIAFDGERGEWVLHDLRSRNGTRLMGSALTHGHVIRFGDHFRIGRSKLLFTHPNELESRLQEERKLAAMGRLSASIGHDLNNLLGAIRAAVTYLRRGHDEGRLSDAHLRECLDDVERATERAADLSRRLMGTPQTAGHTEEIELPALVREVSQLLGRSLPGSIRQSVTVHAEARAWGDRLQLHQVLMNLCRNAQDAMPGGGTIEISVGLSSRAPARNPGIGAPHGWLRVRDDGEGMSAQTLERLFEPYFTTKGAGRGTGLGLANVYDIVKAHGGDIEVQSEVGSGTVFTVRLPSPEKARLLLPGDRTLPPPARAGNPLLVLVVDDEDLLRRALVRLIGQHGHDTLEAPDGDLALALLAERAVDLVLLDRHLPGMDGESCLREIRRRHPETAVVVLSGELGPRDQTRLRALGARETYRKPLAPAELEQLLRRTQRHRQALTRTGEYHMTALDAETDPTGE